jgi:subtilisin family serine protease/sugar lactone lactonase YvrE
MRVMKRHRRPEGKERGKFITANLSTAHRALYLASLFGVIAVCTVAGPFATAKETSSAAKTDNFSGHYIVVLKDSVNHPGAVAKKQTEQRDGDLGVVYQHALSGYAATLPKDQIKVLRHDPRVAYVTIDHRTMILEEEVELETENNEGVEVTEATIPTGINRVFAPANLALGIDGKDNGRADVDVAVLDTGIDYEHPDLDVEARTSCITGTCIDNTGKDGHSHGTHVAGTIGAIDNGEGVVGVAPGARMWAAKVLNDGGSGLESWVIAGVDWVTAHAKDIEAANMSLGCFCSMPALDKAINKSVEAGVVYAVAAGNSNTDAKSFSPASNENVITVSALADYDGKAGAKGSPTCQNYGGDDQRASFSNYGSTIEIVAPGVCILSTEPGGKYGNKSGTSMASPHVAGAAAILAGLSNPNSKKEVEAIRETLIKAGNSGWTDTSGDGVKEPLLDMSNEAIFRFNPAPTFSSNFGTKGSGEGEFDDPTAITVSPINGNVLVADENNNRVQVFNEKGEYLSQFGTEGTGNGQFNEPRGVAVDLKGNIWVTDHGNNRVEKFNEKGEYLSQFGTKGSGNGQFNSPKGLTADSKGNIWVVDSANKRVQKFNEKGEYVCQFNAGTIPVGVAIDPKGDVWSDNSNESGAIEEHNESCEFIQKFASIGEGNGQVDEPKRLAVDANGYIWVPEAANNRVQVFNEKGEYVTKFGTFGTGSEQMKFPAGVAVDPRGNVWVVDDNNSRVDHWIR